MKSVAAECDTGRIIFRQIEWLDLRLSLLTLRLVYLLFHLVFFAANLV